MSLIDRIGANVKKFRTARNISQRELARLSTVSLSLVNWIECGKRDNVTISTLQRIAEVLKVKITDLFQ